MGILDLILCYLNPKITRCCDELFQHANLGLAAFLRCEKDSHKPLSVDEYQHLNFQTKRKIFKNTERIKNLQKEILEIETMYRSKLEVLKTKYPHAFVIICDKYLGGVLYDPSIRMPFNIIEKMILHISGIKGYKYYNKYYALGANSAEIFSDVRERYPLEPKNIQDLKFQDIELLLSKEYEYLENEDYILYRLNSTEASTEILAKEAFLKTQISSEKETVIRMFRELTKTWECPRATDLPCFSLYYYYPISCQGFEKLYGMDDSARKLVWDFKGYNSIDKVTIDKAHIHNCAASFVKSWLKYILPRFFQDYCKQLTFVCIPASTIFGNRMRYEHFSETLCNETGMRNGYSYIKIKSEGEASHLGGTKQTCIELDNYFFHGKYVLIFDDVITTGRSMQRMKHLLENAGATVIGGISIGLTLHSLQKQHPICQIAPSYSIFDDPSIKRINVDTIYERSYYHCSHPVRLY